MKKVVVAFLLVAIGLLGYGLGRKHGARTAPRAVKALVSPVSTPATGTNSKTLASGWTIAVEDREAPFVQNLTSAQRGYEAARASLDDALKQIETLPLAERLGFITGVMSFVGKHHSPAEALKIYHRVPEKHRPNALRGLVAEWISSRSSLDEEKRYLKREGVFQTSGSRFGLEVELTPLLASAQPDAELTVAWLDAFSNHAGRSEILSGLIRRLGRENPDTVLGRAEGWTSWEKEHVTRSFLSNWAYQEPQQAWNWYQEEQERFEGDFSSSIFGPWATTDPERVKQMLNTIEGPAQRQAAIEAVAKVLAEKNTDEAVSWAESLANPRDEQAAHRAVYEAAPRGVGAVLAFENGYPVLRAVVPGSPLEGTGIKPGDRFLEVREADGSRHPLYGKDLNTVVNTIRGEAGTEMALRVLRQSDSGQMEEYGAVRTSVTLLAQDIGNTFRPGGNTVGARFLRRCNR